MRGVVCVGLYLAIGGAVGDKSGREFLDMVVSWSSREEARRGNFSPRDGRHVQVGIRHFL